MENNMIKYAFEQPHYLLNELKTL